MQQRSSHHRRSLLLFPGLLLMAACGDVSPGTAALDATAISLENGIIDGTRSTDQDYPATGVMLFVTEREDGSDYGSMLCSGTLVAPDAVMIAGHCNLALFLDTENPIDYYFSFALDVSKFGDDDNTALPPRTTKVASMIPHPGFSLRRVGPGLRRTNDIALLFLEEAVTDVKPASLIRADEVAKIEAGAEVAIVGYGRRHNERRRRRDAGKKYHGTTRINEVGKWEMQVSPGSPQPHKCHGDSGGPTFMQLGTGDEARLALVGITSHAYDDEDCLHGGVDTRVDPYLGWIKQTMREACEDGSRPVCAAQGDKNDRPFSERFGVGKRSRQQSLLGYR